MVTRQGGGGAVIFFYHIIFLIVYTDLPVREANGASKPRGGFPLGGYVNVGGVVRAGDDIHVVLAVEHALLHGNVGPAGGPAIHLGMVNGDLIARGAEGDPQTVARAVGNLIGIIAHVAAPHGVEPCAITGRDDGPIHRELGLLIVLDGGGGVGGPGRPAAARQRRGIRVIGRIQNAVHALGGARASHHGLAAAVGIVVRKIGVEGIDHAIVPRLHDLPQLVVRIGGVDGGIDNFIIDHDALIEGARVLLPALVLLGGGRLCGFLVGGCLGLGGGGARVGGGVRHGCRVGTCASLGFGGRIRGRRAPDKQAEAERAGRKKGKAQPITTFI